MRLEEEGILNSSEREFDKEFVWWCLESRALLNLLGGEEERKGKSPGRSK